MQHIDTLTQLRDALNFAIDSMTAGNSGLVEAEKIRKSEPPAIQPPTPPSQPPGIQPPASASAPTPPQHPGIQPPAPPVSTPVPATAPVPAPGPAPAPQEQPAISVTDVQAFMARAARQLGGPAVLTEIRKFSPEGKLSDLQPGQLQELYTAVQNRLGGA